MRREEEKGGGRRSEEEEGVSREGENGGEEWRQGGHAHVAAVGMQVEVQWQIKARPLTYWYVWSQHSTRLSHKETSFKILVSDLQ